MHDSLLISHCFQQDILKDAREGNLKSASELPYFEGDFWPTVLEEGIKELDQEETRKETAPADGETDKDSLAVSIF